jgi:hypothetical protein
MKGTPKTLREAVEHSNETTERSVRDYLAQKFTVAMTEAPDVETELLLRKLWEAITRG